MPTLLQTSFLRREQRYDGSQLTTHWCRRVSALETDALVAFIGEARVPTANLVDQEDREQGATIVARQMLHFVGVYFERPLAEMVWRQRLYMSRIAQRLNQRGVELTVIGDDLYLPATPPRKLSVSIATVSQTAGLLHIGVNIDPTGAPVPAVGLAELGVDAKELGQELLTLFAKEEESVRRAVAKVRAVE